MFKSNWHKYATFGLVIFAVLIGFGLPVWLTQPTQIFLKGDKLYPHTSPDKVAKLVWDCEQHKTIQTVDDHAATKPGTKSVLGQTNGKQPDTEDGAGQKAECIQRNHDDSDLQAQWRAADSAKNAIAIAISNYWLSVINFVALLFTLIAAFWAAWESKKSADTAVRQLRQAEKFFESENRPWIKVTGGKLGAAWIDKGGYHVNVEFSAENVGKSLAVDVKLWLLKSYHNYGVASLRDFQSHIDKREQSQPKRIFKVIFPNDKQPFFETINLNVPTDQFDEPNFPIVRNISGVIEYRLSGNESILTTPFVLHVMASKDNYPDREVIMNDINLPPT